MQTPFLSRYNFKKYFAEAKNFDEVKDIRDSAAPAMSVRIVIQIMVIFSFRCVMVVCVFDGVYGQKKAPKAGCRGDLRGISYVYLEATSRGSY